MPSKRGHSSSLLDVARAAMCLLVATGIIVGGPSGNDSYADDRGGAVLLKNDRVLQGAVERRGEMVSIRMGQDSQVSIPSDQVEYLGADLVAIYDYKVAQVKKWVPGEHWKLTRWCMLHGLLDQAAEHYQGLADSHRDHPRVKQLAIELQKKMLEQPEFRQHLGLPPLGAVANQASGAVEPNQKIADNTTTGSVVTASASVTNAAMHPEIAAIYSRRVQPILLNRCSQAACHGVTSQNGLRIIEPYRSAYERLTSNNLTSVLGQLSSDSAQLSPLIKYATTAHGIQRQPGISLSETHLLTEISNWIQFVQHPVTTAAGTRPVVAAQNSAQVSGMTRVAPFAPAVELVPVRPGASGLRPVPKIEGDSRIDASEFPEGDMPSMNEIDALDRQLRQMLGEDTPGNAGSQGDAFDPAEFNRGADTGGN